MANNVSRKRFYLGNIIAIASLAAFMALIEVILNNVLKAMLPYMSTFEQLYIKDFFLADFAWSFGLYMLLASLGWIITMIYYRSNKLMKTVVSLVPVFVIVLGAIINNLVDGAITRALGRFFSAALGFSYGKNAYIAFLSFIIGTLGVLALSFLLIRRMPLKD